MTTISRCALVVLAGSLLLSACADKNTQPSRAGATTTSRSSHASSAGTAPAKPPRARSASHEPPLPASTGIAACDDFLSSYLACHRAAHIYAPDQLQTRYQAMRTTLLRDSQNPDIRPQLGARCSSLATQLREVLHGKPCDDSAATPTGTR